MAVGKITVPKVTEKYSVTNVALNDNTFLKYDCYHLYVGTTENLFSAESDYNFREIGLSLSQSMGCPRQNSGLSCGARGRFASYRNRALSTRRVAAH